jgi:hypothetical protein
MALMRPAPPREIESLLRDGYSIGIGDRFNEAMEIFKANMGPLIGLGAVFLIINIVFALIPILGPIVIGFICVPLFMGACLRFAFEALRGKKPTVNDFTAIGSQAGPVLIGFVIVDIITMIGSFLCVLPGLFVGIVLIFTLPVIVDRRMDPIEAIKASYKVVMKNFVEVLLAGLVAVGIGLAGVLACGIGMIVTTPFIFVFLACVYAHVFGLTGAPEGENNPGGNAGVS